MDLGDRRRIQCLIESASRIAQYSERSLHQIFDGNNLRAFYRLCNCPQATVAQLQ
ncbi:MAG: transposase [Bacteroidales bacterium]|nr:transposase [Bacteroidales bacterium]